MRHVGSRIRALHRKLRPPGLVKAWYDLYYGLLVTVARRRDPNAEVPSEEELWEMARRGAATGRDPGEVFAEYIAKAVKEHEAKEREAEEWDEEPFF